MAPLLLRTWVAVTMAAPRNTLRGTRRSTLLSGRRRSLPPRVGAPQHRALAPVPAYRRVQRAAGRGDAARSHG